MTAIAARLARRLSPQPTRDLIFIDAVAIALTVFFAWAFWAGTRSGTPLSWEVVWPLTRQALPISVLAALLSCAALGLYGSGARLTRLRTCVAAVAYAVALVIVADAWYRGGAPPFRVVVAALVAGSGALYVARLLYWRLSP